MPSSHSAALSNPGLGRRNSLREIWTMLAPPRERLEPLALLRELHSSLDPAEVMARFVRQLRGHFDVEAVSFEHADFGWQDGAGTSEQCRFGLRPAGSPLGKLVLGRNHPFSRSERAELARLADLLSHPLRNAIDHAALQRQACEDGLTGLLNRRALERILPRELAVATRESRPLALALLDLDHFKQINDRWGHAAGDRILCDVSAAMSRALRQSDLAFRIGGEEFVLLLPDTDEFGAARVLQRLRVLLPKVARSRTGGVRPELEHGGPGFSAGIACATAEVTPDQLLARADSAMYLAKQAGRNRHRVWTQSRAA